MNWKKSTVLHAEYYVTIRANEAFICLVSVKRLSHRISNARQIKMGKKGKAHRIKFQTDRKKGNTNDITTRAKYQDSFMRS